MEFGELPKTQENLKNYSPMYSTYNTIQFDAN